MPTKCHFALSKTNGRLKNISYKYQICSLILENGEILWGYGLGAKKAVIGELCFNTSQTGYQEALTDPSYAKQIITFSTYRHC